MDLRKREENARALKLEQEQRRLELEVIYFV